jgi:hypothetical protein
MGQTDIRVDYVPDARIPMPAADRIVHIPGPAEPESIHVEQIRVAVAALGLGNDLNGIKSIHMEGNTVTIVRFRPGADGRRHAPAGDDPSTVTTTIGVIYA